MTVSIGRVHSAGGAAKYFASDNYYSTEQGEATSQWAGAGAQALGLTGRVDTATFERILEGHLPDGSQVGDPATRDQGRDFTFSMPKSASLLALVSGDTRILEAHVAAVKDTMKWAEANLAEARIKVDGKDVAVRTGNLVYALFQHDTSRATDPQSHIHAVIANLTQLPYRYRQSTRIDGRTGEAIRDDGWRAWHNSAMYRASTLLTSMTNANLRDRIEQLGYTTEVTGEHGAFEVMGPNGERITAEALAGFSKRATDIRAKAEELGITSAEGRRAITQRTRDPKVDAGDRGELLARWRVEARTLGYNGDDIARAARDHVRERSGIERGALAVGAAIRDASAKLADVLQRPDDPLVDRGLARLTMLPATARTQYATASAIRILGEREVAFKIDDVVKTALDLGQKGVTHDRIEKRIDQLVRGGELVFGKSTRQDGAVTLVTTREAIAQERRILGGVIAGDGKGRPLMPADVAAERLQALAGERQLNDQQLAAAVQIVASEDRVVLVQGRAGAGKSTMLQPVAKAEALDAAARMLEDAGVPQVLLTADMRGDAKALAFQNKMVADLKADTGLEAMTVHSFISRNERFLAAEHRGEGGSGQGDGLAGGRAAQAFAARKAELAGSYLILDEASMISNDQMDRLIAIANLMEVGRLAVIGDRKQLNPIEGGKSFALMQAAAVREGRAINEVNINMRQRNAPMRLVADLADAGNIKGAFAVLGKRIVETEDRVTDAAHAWLALTRDERERTVLLPSGREARAEINTIIQDKLRAEGTLKGDGRSFMVREQVNLTHEELRYSRLWGAARFLEVARGDNSLGLARGDYRIERRFANGRFGLVDEQGNRHRIDPRKIDPMKPRDGLRLAIEKEIRIHEGERIRWTDSDKREGRGMLNATIASVERVSGDGIVVKLADGAERTLANGDPMLKRMDLAYAINTHMAQGITASVVYAVMGSFERNLSNARSFLVNLTRQQDDVRIFTDDRDKLMRQIASNRGDKLSALETTGELAVEARLAEYSAVTREAAAGAQDKAGGSSPANSLGEELRGTGRDSRDLALAEVSAVAADAPTGVMTAVAGERADAGSGRRDDPDRFGLSTDSAKPDLAAGKGPDDGPGNGPGDGPGGGGASAPQPERSQPERDRSKGLEL
jgi:conjugative relaxase-like TrwC/TraI family protein